MVFAMKQETDDVFHLLHRCGLACDICFMHFVACLNIRDGERVCDRQVMVPPFAPVGIRFKIRNSKNGSMQSNKRYEKCTCVSLLILCF